MLRGGIPFSNAPGTAYEYSNYGFAILGRIVSNVSGMPYATIRRANILQPLGMTATTLDPAKVPADRLARRLPLGGRALEGRAAAPGWRLRRDGRHADVASAIWPLRRRSTSPRGRRVTAPEPARSAARRCARCSSPGGPSGQRSRVARHGRDAADAGGYGFGLASPQTCASRDASRTAAVCPASDRRCAGCPTTASASSRSATSPTLGGAASSPPRSIAWTKTGGLQRACQQPSPRARAARARLALIVEVGRALAAERSRP